MADKKSKKISKYPAGLNLNLGFIIFTVILIYVIICVVAYLRSRHIVGYEVKEGSLSTNRIYNSAFALRKEEVFKSNTAGYVNYFASESSRIGVGGLVYTVDSAGGLQEMMMAEGAGSISLSNEDLANLRTQIVGFSSNFSPKLFNTVYEFKNALQGSAQKMTNAKILESMKAVNDARVESIEYCTASKTGIVVYNTDGFENITLDSLSKKIVEGSAGYKKTQIDSSGLVSEGEAVYKLIEDENWSLVISVDKETAEELVAEDYIRVKFLKNQDKSWAKVSSVTTSEGDSLVVLSFNNSVLTYAADRYLGIELLLTEQRGLKIPNSSIVEKSFYIIKDEFITMGQNGNQGVLKRIFNKNGEESVDFTEATVYYSDAGYSYIDLSVLEAGDTLYKPDSSEICTVGEQKSLTGVYNINKGFADFRQINVLYKGDEYSIVQSNTMYGLSVYDHIVLDASAIKENQLIYD